MHTLSVIPEIRMKGRNPDRGIPDTGNPEPCLASDEGVLKNALCTHYDQCLDFALAEKWSQFTCQACRFQNARTEINPNAPEMMGYYRLLCKIFARKEGALVLQ